MLDYRRRHPEISWPDWILLSRNPVKFQSENAVLACQHGVSFVSGDIRTFELNLSVDSIVHAAATLSPYLDVAEMCSTIVDGTAHVIDVAHKISCRKVLFASSGAVYGPMTEPVSEETPCSPSTPYGRSKVRAESLLIGSGLEVKIARCFAFVGRHLDRTIYYAIGNFIRDALAGKDIVINGDGSPMRSYMYADDLVEWLFAILERGQMGRPYNVGSDEAVSIRMLAEIVKNALSSSCRIQVLDRIAESGAANFYVPDVRRAKSELGLSVKTGLVNAISLSSGGV